MTTSAAASMPTCAQWQCVAGSLANLNLVRDVPMPRLPKQPNFARIRVAYVGLNFADMFACLGLYSATPTGVFVPGLEFSGVIEALSEGTTTADADESSFCVGDRVFGVTRFGGYTTSLVVDLRYVRKIFPHWTLEQSAAFPCQALTAWYGLKELANIKRGQTVLVHSAAGGTGLWALKICGQIGAHVIATVSSESKRKELLRIAPSNAMLTHCRIIVRDECSSTASMKNALRTALDDCNASHLNVVLDSLLGDWFNVCHDALGPQGRHVVLGAGSMTPHGDQPNWIQLGYRYLKRPRLDPLAMISTNKSLMAFNLIWLYENTDDVGRLFADLLEAARDMEPAHVGATFPFEDAVTALREFQTGKTIGKVLLRVEDEEEEAEGAK